MSVGTDERHRLTADTGVGFPVPQELSAGCGDGLYYAFESPIEHESARCGQHVTGQWEALIYFPCRRATLEIPCDELPARLSWRVLHAHVRTDVRGALEVARIASFDVHTETAHRIVQKAGRGLERRVASNCTDPCGTDIPYLFIGLWTRARGLGEKGVGSQLLARAPVQHIKVAVRVRMQQQLAILAVPWPIC